MIRDELVQHLENLVEGRAEFRSKEDFYEWVRKSEEALRALSHDINVLRDANAVVENLEYEINDITRLVNNLLNSRELMKEEYGFVRGALIETYDMLRDYDVKSPYDLRKKIEYAISQMQSFKDEIPEKYRGEMEEIIEELSRISDDLYRYNDVISHTAENDVEKLQEMYDVARENFVRIKREAEQELEILEKTESISWEPHFVQLRSIF